MATAASTTKKRPSGKVIWVPSALLATPCQCMARSSANWEKLASESTQKSDDWRPPPLRYRTRANSASKLNPVLMPPAQVGPKTFIYYYLFIY